MKNRLALALLAAAVLAAFSLPAQAQRAARPTVTAPPTPGSTGIQQWVFVPGFGLRPIIQERFPPFTGRRFFPGFPGFFGGGIWGHNFFAGGFWPYTTTSGSSTTVVVVPQEGPVQVPVGVTSRRVLEAIVPLGLPENWSEVHSLPRPSYTAERQAARQITLLALKDQAILAATDYWLEDGRIFFVNSAGEQFSVAARDLDWDMTTRLNAERNVPFILRSGR